MTDGCSGKPRDSDDFETLAWSRMERTYEGFFRSKWLDDAGVYSEGILAWLGKYHIYRCKHKGWGSDEDRRRALRIVDHYVDPGNYEPGYWTGHPAGVWMAIRFLCLAYRYRGELGMPESRSGAIHSLLRECLETHLWTKGSSQHGNQNVYSLYLIDAWQAFRAFGEGKYWEWVLHFLSEIKRLHNRPYVDDVRGTRGFRFLQPDLTWNYANDKSNDGHPQNLHTPNYFDTCVGEFICVWQEIQETTDHRDSEIDGHIRDLENLIFYDWMYDGSPSYFSSGYGIHRMHHGLTWASMLVFPIALAYHKSGAHSGMGRFLLEQFARSIPRYDVMDGDPEDGAIPAAYFGTRHFCGTKGEGNSMWLQRLSKALEEYRVQDVRPQSLECWADFRDWNQGVHYSCKVFDMGVIGYQMFSPSSGIGMQTSLGEPTLRDTRTGRIVVASNADPPNFKAPESGADFLFQMEGKEPLWLSQAAEGRRATVFSYRSSALPDWVEHLTPYRCHELDGKRGNPHSVDVHSEVVRAEEPRFAGGNLVRATRDAVVQASYLVNLQADMQVRATGKYYCWMRDEEMALACTGNGEEVNLGIHVPVEFSASPAGKRVKWFWARYAGYGMLFIPVWDEMEGIGEGWILDIDRSNMHLGKYTSQALGAYSLRGGGRMKIGDGWRTCVVLRPTTAELEDARAFGSFYSGTVRVEGEGARLGSRTFFVPGREIPEHKMGNRPWDVVVEGVRSGSSFELCGPIGRGTLTVTLRGEDAIFKMRCAYDGRSEWQEVPFDRPAQNVAILSLGWNGNHIVRVDVA